MLQKQAEYEEQIEIMLQKISQLEKAKSRLQSEVEVLIVDLEKAQNTIAILERAKEQLEKTVNELKVPHPVSFTYPCKLSSFLNRIYHRVLFVKLSPC